MFSQAQHPNFQHPSFYHNTTTLGVDNVNASKSKACKTFFCNCYILLFVPLEGVVIVKLNLRWKVIFSCHFLPNLGQDRGP